MGEPYTGTVKIASLLALARLEFSRQRVSDLCRSTRRHEPTAGGVRARYRPTWRRAGIPRGQRRARPGAAAVAAHAGQQVVARPLGGVAQRIDQRQALRGTIGHGHGHRAVEGCHGSAYTGHFRVGVIRPAEAGGGAGRSRHIPASVESAYIGHGGVGISRPLRSRHIPASRGP